MKLRKLAVGALVLLALPIALFASYRPDRALRSATAAVADIVCAKTFVSGLDPQTVFAETLERPGIRLLHSALRYKIDRDAGIVEVSMMGLLANRSAFHRGFGCVLLNGPTAPYLPNSNIEALRQPLQPPLLPDIAGSDLVEPSSPALKTALEHAFAEAPAPPLRRTSAVVVVKDGKVIAERYAAGIGIDTELMGFSMTKSVVNALLGILTGQGRLSPEMPAPLPEWRDPADAQHAITIEQLMRMTTGLALDEANSGFDASSRMLLYRDMAGFAVRAPVMVPPGTRWAYSSASTQILARIVRDAAGGPEQALRLAWRELFNPLGMRHVTLQFDGTGTLQGFGNMLASARDWARFGLLYLDDGVISGKRILPEGWVEFSAKATLDSDYGAGFWTDRSQDKNALGRVKQGIPADAFFAFGLLGQRLVMLPTQHLVIVRLGDSVDPTGDIRGLERLVREVIAATSTPASAAK